MLHPMEKVKVVKARSWKDLPEILEPGIYNVSGETYTIEEDVPKKVVLRTLKYKKAGKTLI